MTEDNLPEDWQAILAQADPHDRETWKRIAKGFVENAAEDDALPLQIEDDTVVIEKEDLAFGLGEAFQMVYQSGIEHER